MITGPKKAENRFKTTKDDENMDRFERAARRVGVLAVLSTVLGFCFYGGLIYFAF